MYVYTHTYIYSYIIYTHTMRSFSFVAHHDSPQHATEEAHSDLTLAVLLQIYGAAQKLLRVTVLRVLRV